MRCIFFGNKTSKQVGAAKARGEDIDVILKQVSDVGEKMAQHEAQLDKVQSELSDFLLRIPNLPDSDIPAGASEADNELMREVGDIPEFDFEVSDHVTVGEQLGMLDMPAAAKLSGSRFCVLRGDLVRLQRALMQYMLDVHISEHDYTEHYVPYLVQAACLQGTGQFPKFEEDVFTWHNEDLQLNKNSIPNPRSMLGELIGLPIRSHHSL